MVKFLIIKQSSISIDQASEKTLLKEVLILTVLPFVLHANSSLQKEINLT